MKNKLGCLVILVAVLSVGCSDSSVESDSNANIDVVEAEQEVQQNIEEEIEQEVENEEQEVNLNESKEEIEKMLAGDISDDERAKLENDLAGIYRDEENYEKAIEIATHSSEITEDSIVIHDNNVVIADCYQELGELEKALDKYNEANESNIERELVKYNEAYILTQKCRVYMNLGQFEKAKENIEEVIYTTDEIKATAIDKIYGYMLLASVYYEEGDIESASKACEDGYMFAIKANEYDPAISLFMLRAMLHEEVGEYDKAYEVVSDAIVFCNEVLSLGFNEVVYEKSLMLENYKAYLEALK